MRIIVTKTRATVTLSLGVVLLATSAPVAWADVNTWTNAGLDGVSVLVLAVDPSTSGTLYAGTDDQCHFAGYDCGGGGVHKSTDGGNSWTPSGLLHESVVALAIDPVAPRTLYAGSSVFSHSVVGGLFKSVDGGNSWSGVGADAIHNVQALAIDPAAPSTLYAGTFFDGVFKSTDSGDTWRAINTGLRDRFGYISTVEVLVIDPSAPSTLYLATSRGGADRGGAEGPEGAGVFKRKKGDSSWYPAGNPGYVHALAIDPTAPRTLYAAIGEGCYGSCGGVSKSTDGGSTWTALDLSDLAGYMQTLVIDPTNPRTLYAGAFGVIKSTNSGSTWKAFNNGLPAPLPFVQSLVFDPTSSERLYAGVSCIAGFTDCGVLAAGALPTPTETEKPTQTPRGQDTSTPSPTSTRTPTPSRSATSISTPTPSPADTRTQTPTDTASAVATETASPTVTFTLEPTPAPNPCVGDCSGDNTVTIEELVTMVSIALDSRALSACTAGDANSDGGITVDELVTAVGSAINECALGPGPTSPVAPRS